MPMPCSIASRGLDDANGCPRQRISPASALTSPARIFEQRRLAGAVLADERVRLALGDVEADAAERVHGAKGFLDAVELQAQAAKW